MNAKDQKLFDQLAEENRHQREIIRELIRERIETEKYWKNFILKVLQQAWAK